MAALAWDIEGQVQGALQDQPGPSACPEGRLFVPEALCSQVLQWGHDSLLACHPRATRTSLHIAQRFWWPNLEREVREYVQACPVCNRNKTSNRPPAGLLQPLPVPSRPWSYISLDFVTGLPASEGKTVILTVVDSRLVWVEYAHNFLTCSATGMSPFQCVYGYQPPLFPSQEGEASCPSVLANAHRCRRTWARARVALRRVVASYSAGANRHRTPAPAYRVGQRVWLSTKDLPVRVESWKLAARFLGLFVVERVISPTAVCLWLPTTMRVHPTFPPAGGAGAVRDDDAQLSDRSEEL
ncbi:hypothetical protein ACEWY4_007725 [Coilia grayii]|uniref:Gypsy retrotransposon integrase-like protein 1 n=1 Tax=Coilia grayii TaxID=363190 RepID=A0ABD1K8V4_9TELE